MRNAWGVTLAWRPFARYLQLITKDLSLSAELMKTV